MTECVISLLTHFTSLLFWSFDAGHVTICTNRMKLHTFNFFHICRKCTKTRVSKVYRALNENLFTVTMGLNGLIKQAVTCYYYDPAPAPELKPHSVTEQSEVLMLPMGMYSVTASVSPALWPDGSGDCLLSAVTGIGTAIWLRSMVCWRGLASLFSFTETAHKHVKGLFQGYYQGLAILHLFYF